MTISATYRLQLHSDFTFADAEARAPYLASLGVSHVYASPIATARAGSRHGYDVVDPTTISQELGGEPAFRSLASTLRAHGLGIILDIVPNHMAVGARDNRWWLDVLEKGQASEHAAFFDIDWSPPDLALQGKVLAPFLGAPYAEALSSGEIVLEFEAATGRLTVVASRTHGFPVRSEDYAEVLAGGPDALAQRYDGGDPEGRAALHALLERQHYRLCWWRNAGDEINWRRFFDITELAGVRVEREEVFETLHRLPLRLYAEGLIDGVRADHVDGLADPAAYCQRLRGRLEEASRQRPSHLPKAAAYFVVEKILAPSEALCADWRVDGTTGYDYMNEASALLHDDAGVAALSDHWERVSGRSPRFAEEERLARPELLGGNFAGQLQTATAAFHALARSSLATRDLSAASLRRALVALLTVFPCYRTYGVGDAGPASDRDVLQWAVGEARRLTPTGEEGALDQIASWIRGEGPGPVDLRQKAVRRFQQLSAPVSAKAVEDTAFYRYGRLQSRNDVGFDPARLAAPPVHFHKKAQERARAFPAAMVTTASHDHKHGEDVRARLAVLSEIADVWVERSSRWSVMNQPYLTGVHPADEYTLYQTMVGVFPLDLRIDDLAALATFEDRLAGWQEKALREAKLRSSWSAPDEAYEARCRGLLHVLLDPGCCGAFLADLGQFVNAIAAAGAMNGLVQAFLRCMTPGMPDLYQGCELWDLTLVDPDNRRPVDFDLRAATLAQTMALDDRLKGWRDGAIKQTMIAQTLALRKSQAPVFEIGDYVPLEITGARRDHVLAFVRKAGDAAVLIAVPLHCAAALWEADRPLPSPAWWADTLICSPVDLSSRTPQGMTRIMGAGLLASEIFMTAPFAARVLPA